MVQIKPGQPATARPNGKLRGGICRMVYPNGDILFEWNDPLTKKSRVEKGKYQHSKKFNNPETRMKL